MAADLANQISETIRRAREAKALSKSELARRVGVSRQRVQAWESGSLPKPDVGKLIERALDLPKGSISPNPSHANVAIIPNEELTRRRVPLIDWVDAGLGSEAVEALRVDIATEYVEASFATKENSFALTIRGDSMEPEFRSGDVIIIDPALEPVSGDFVVAQLDSNGSSLDEPGNVTFKQYRPRGPAAYDLLPLNPDYPTITVNKHNPGHIIGTMTEHHRVRRTRR